MCTKSAPQLKTEENLLCLGTKKNPSIVRIRFEDVEEIERSTPSVPKIVNQERTFDYCAPTFHIQSIADKITHLWWQISPDPHFLLVPGNLDHIESYSSTISLPLISETFLSPDQPYYLRIRSGCSGKWSEWSSTFTFTVGKPLAVEEVEFEPLDDQTYELNWDRRAEESDEPIEYLVFGSNSIDFMPVIYCDKQVNAIVNGAVVEEECNDNLIATTTETSIKVNGGLAYYRILARQKGQLSVPSQLIHIYDQDLIQPRNALQVCKEDLNGLTAKRSLFPLSYPENEIALPHVNVPDRKIALENSKLFCVQQRTLRTLSTPMNHLMSKNQSGKRFVPTSYLRTIPHGQNLTGCSAKRVQPFLQMILKRRALKDGDLENGAVYLPPLIQN